MSAIQQMFLATFVAAGLDMPEFIGAGAFFDGVGALSVTPPETYINGDLLVLIVTSANQTIATPSGWTQVPNSPQGTGTAAATESVAVGVFYKIASGTQAAVSVSDSGAVNAAQIFCFRKVNTSTPIDSTAGSVAATKVTPHTLPAITTVSKNVLVAHCAGIGLDAASLPAYTNPTNANLANVAVQSSRTVATGTGTGIGLVTGEKSSAGSTGTTSVSVSSAAKGAFVTVGIAPSTNYNGTGRAIGVNGTVEDTAPTGISTVSLTLKTDGTFTTVGFPTFASWNQYKWYNNPTASIGNSYWVKATLISGSNPTAGNSVGTWHALSSDVFWENETTGDPGSVAYSVLKLEFATDSLGTNIVATSRLVLSASTDLPTVDTVETVVIP